jgi:site-specific DNA-methyltransferase (adenine-specific)
MVIWDKDNSGNFADAELAWTSFTTAVRIFKWRWNGMLQQNMAHKQIRQHPTEKPIQLYEWLLMNYAKPGDKILDTHGGSGSICIACHNLGFDLDWCELDAEYFEAAKKRFEIHKAQLRMFQ